MKFTTEGITEEPYIDWASEYYANCLHDFLGFGTVYGNSVNNEYDGIKFLINVLKKSILEQEKIANNAMQVADENGIDLDNALEANSLAKKLRPFSYKALYLLAFSFFEGKISEFNFFIEEFKGRKEIPCPEFTAVFDAQMKYIDQHFGDGTFKNSFADRFYYAEIRNAMTHRNGIARNEACIQWSKSIPGVSIADGKNGKIKFTITNSIFIIDFLNKSLDCIEDLANRSLSLPNTCIEKGEE